MENDKFQELVLEQFQVIAGELKSLKQGQKSLEQGQKKLEQGQKKLQSDVTEIKGQVKGIWEDIKRLDDRLIAQEAKNVW